MEQYSFQNKPKNNAGTGTSTLIREYIWMGGVPVGVVEGGQVFFIRTDHIGRPVFATNDLGVKVWEASYLPFGRVQTATGGIDLRFPPSRASAMHCRAAGQWFQSESGLHQNWMRDVLWTVPRARVNVRADGRRKRTGRKTAQP